MEQNTVERAVKTERDAKSRIKRSGQPFVHCERKLSNSTCRNDKGQTRNIYLVIYLHTLESASIAGILANGSGTE